MKRIVASLIACAVFVLALTHIASAGTITGTWKLSAHDTPGAVQFVLRTASADGRHDDESGNSVTLASLGLTSGQVAGPSGRVTFTLAHDAGNIVCIGTLGDGWGAGTFTFRPSPSYAAAMRSRGSAVEDDWQQMTAAMLDITIAYVDGLGRAGFTQVPFHDLVGMRALQVTPQYVTDMRAAGVAFAAPRETVEARALRVDPGFVREMAAVGYPNLSVRELVELRAMKIDAAYVRKVAAHGFHNLPIRKLVEVKAMQVI